MSPFLYRQTTVITSFILIQQVPVHETDILASFPPLFLAPLTVPRAPSYLFQLIFVFWESSNVFSANRAGCLSDEPFIYTMYVEEMPTARQQPSRFAIRQILPRNRVNTSFQKMKLFVTIMFENKHQSHMRTLDTWRKSCIGVNPRLGLKLEH